MTAYTIPSPLESALSFLKLGWQPVPIPFRGKGPRDNEWQKRIITVETASRYFNGAAQNIGVALGRASGGLAHVDLDCPETIALAPELLPQTGAVFGRHSKPRSDYLYVSNLCDTEDAGAFQFKDPLANGLNAMLVELRIGGKGKGAQTVFPGSTHETGEQILWASEGEPARVDGAALKLAVAKLAAAALLVRNYPGDGARHDAALSLGGLLARCDWTATGIDEYVGLIARVAGDAEWRERGKSAAGAVAQLQKGAKVRGLPRAGEPWWATPRLEAEVIVPEQELRREVDDAWETKILTWLADGMPGLPAQSEPRVRVWEVALFALGLEAPRLGRAEQNRITTALDRAGWGRAPRTGAGCWWAPKVSE